MADDDEPANLDFDEDSKPMEVDEPSFALNAENECHCLSKRCRDFNLSQQLDNILEPGLIFSSPNQPERLWTILSHGHQDAAAFIKTLGEYRIESHCALAWPTGYVAYRCRTCSALPTMSLCAECFRAGDHSGHDYNMFKSRSGGACDCGFNIMEASGHCSNHGLNATAPRAHEPVPESLTCITSRAMPRILSRLVIQLRRHAVGQTMETDIYLDCLMKITNSNAILKNIMVQVILSADSYSSQAELLSNHPDSRVSKIVRESQKILKRERKKLVAFKIPANWPVTSKPISAFSPKAPHKTFLEELVFWMVVHDFHQKLVCFLLGFFMDGQYKETFARLFVNYYPNIAMCLASSPTDARRNQQDSFENLSRRILQVSVQIYNDSNLTRMICEEEMTLHTLIYCIRIMIEGSQPDGIFSALKTNPLCKHDSDAPKVVCCDNLILRDRQMSSFTDDLITILDFEHEAKRLLSDKKLLQTWMELLSYFQTMSPYKRELNEHAPYETGPRQSVFLIENEFCLLPLWTILDHLMGPDSVIYTSQLLESIHATLASWLYRMSIGPHSKLDTYFMSFHIPLHRILAATLRHMIYVQKVPEEQVYNLLCDNQSIFGSKFSYRSAHGTRVAIKMDDFIKMLLLHPLQALTLYHQTRSGMWTRNGILTVNQAITYVHCAYCYSIIDMDMFLLRYFAFKLKADTFLRSFLQKFYAWHCLSFTCGPIFSDATIDALKVHYYFNIQPEQITQMVESCLVTLIQLLTLGNHCNISNREQTKQEMICLISVANRSYSYLAEMLPSVPEQHKDEEMFSSLLDELTIYKPATHGSGGNLQQGYYTLRPDVWENEYNPIHVLYRYYQRRDYQLSLDRFFQHAKSTGKLNRRSHSSTLWPPLRIPDKIGDFGPIDLGSLVRCQTLLGVVFSILYKNIYVEEIPDSMMAYTIHLLELALRKQMEVSNEHSDKMDHDQHQDQKSRAKNPSFVGRYSYRELISYYENMPKEEAMLKGRTIYSLFTEDLTGPEPNSNVKLFPFVKHALDLSFDTTWFPFDSVIDNCLVHIETVHSLPRDEFDAMIQCANSEKSSTESTYGECPYATASSDRASEQSFPDMSTSSSTRSTESQTGVWSNLIGLEVDEVDDIEIEVDDSEENDVILEIDDLNDDEVTVEVEDPDELELSLLNQLSASETSPSTASPGLLAGAASEASTSTSLTTAATITPTMEVVNSILPNLNNSRVAPITSGSELALNSRGRDINIEGYIRLRDYMDQLGTRNQQNVTPDAPAASAIIHHNREEQEDGSASTPANVDGGSNSGRQGQVSRPYSSEWTESPRQPQQPAQAQNLITERRAILDSQPRHMITNSPQPLALEGTSASPMSGVTNTSSASTSTANQDVQQAHSSRGLAVELKAFDQNSTRAIVERTANLTEARQSPGSSNQTERSLTEIDIQARFMSFFSTDTTSPSTSRFNTSRIIRPRQTARRGNYRGAYLIEPYLPYNNLNNNNNNNATTTNNNNNNNNESVQELVRRSVAVVPAIADAVRSTLNQRVGQATARTPVTAAVAAAGASSERNQSQVGSETRELNESSRSSSNSPPSNLPAANERITPAIWMRNRVAMLTSSGPHQLGNRFITTGSTQQQIQTDQRSRRLRKEHRQHHGESVMTLLLRLHAKYSHQPRSYHYDDSRVRTNLDLRKRCRIGDGAHFVTIALDLLCASDVQIRQRVEYLTELIWPKPTNEKVAEKEVSVDGSESNERTLSGETSAADSDDKEIGLKTSIAGKSSCVPTASGDSQAPGACTTPVSVFGLNLSNTVKSDSTPINPLASLTPEEKRHRAKERQTRLMAEFAKKQRAFMEKYAASATDLTSTGAGSRPLSDLNTGPTSAVMAHSASAGSAAAGCSSQKYSDSALQAGDKPQGTADSDPQGRYEEQPINLSSKSNQGQASRWQSVSDADNNGQKGHQATACEPLGQRDSVPDDQAQSTSTSTAASSSSVATSDKDILTTNESGLTGPRGGGRHQQQRQSSTNDIKDTRTSNVFTSSSSEAANDGPHYECCICGVGGLSDPANPLGQVVLLQSTSVYGHSHLRPRSERKLPCDETEHSSLKEETYAKYLERRIDVLCDHFTKSSWLDSINIGAEGGVHVQSCGHHLHIECHQSYIRSLDLEDVMRMRNESDEFQCPVCRQLANSVLPILNDDFFLDTSPVETGQAFPSTSKFSPAKKATKITCEPWDGPNGQRIHSEAKINYDPTATNANCPSHSTALAFSTALTPSESLDDQIAQVGSQLRNRRAPNQRELQSSATFCSHLTKATGPQYRLVRTNPSMHSLFLFLSSIARTNLETGLIARSIRSHVVHEQAGTSGGDYPSGLNAFSAATQQDQQQRPAIWPKWQPTAGSGKGKHTCYQLLFHVLALNAQTLINDQWCSFEHIWSRLTHHIAEADRLSVRPHNSEVPLLLRDPVAMLLQFLFTISGSKSHRRTHFTCLVKILFNLTVIQSVALVLSYLKSVPQLRDDELSNQSFSGPQPSQPIKIPSQLDGSQAPNMDQQLGGSVLSSTFVANRTVESNQRLLGLESLLSSVWTNLGPLLTRNKEEPLMHSVVRNSWSRLAGRREQELWHENQREQQRQQAQSAASQTDDYQANRVAKLEFIENRIKLACFPFLRAAAYLQEHLYGGPRPNLICELNEDCLSEEAPVDEDFSQLVQCLGLGSTNFEFVAQQTAGPTRATPTFGGDAHSSSSAQLATNIKQALGASSHITLHQALNWPPSAGSKGRNLVVSWAAELLQFAKQYSIAARTLLLSRPLAWYRPALMQLPSSFDDIFMFYYRRKCSLCQQVPKDVAVCLVCGAPICFRASCCKDRSRSRQVHSQHCGANTAVFLAVHTSAVVVIRGNRACVWGSVYLDAHDEEDNGLQRGKPLYMVPARFALLETQWLSHSFDHTCGKRWIYLSEAQ